ncbi:nerve growth factor-like [Ruditapes philippinarum]|uniref:nerve growth factor-like n=1 Tax=Ruditapes philippinarum TaxID=129788 RepID=UPI00295A72EA|nr:nerve growth factor-like [Ruditapes philippinarum]
MSIQRVISIILVIMCLHISTLFARSSDSKNQHSNDNSHSQMHRPPSEVSILHPKTKLSREQGYNKGIFDTYVDSQESTLAAAVLESSVRPKTSRRQSQNVRQTRSIDRKKSRNGRKHNRNKSGRKKHKGLERMGLKRKSCPTRTEYVYKKTAEDVFGDTVDVYPVIQIGNLALDQYFYETFCDVEKCECAGVDTTKYESSCRTTHSYSYARIVKSGEIGWGLIKVRSGCSCVVNEKRRSGGMSIADLLT